MTAWCKKKRRNAQKNYHIYLDVFMFCVLIPAQML